ncbi:hypothetical protein LZ32DRAFT_221799 [Colletotrichum eremochloae]|nr:hypothetical protein LZ32DRAFT_221799 [Colletotrichum eremochloae]
MSTFGLGVQTLRPSHRRHRTIRFRFTLRFALLCRQDPPPGLSPNMLRFLLAAFHHVTWPRSGWISSNDLTPVCLCKGTLHSSLATLPSSWLANLLAASLSHLAACVSFELVPAANDHDGHVGIQPRVTRHKPYDPILTLRPFDHSHQLPNARTRRSNNQYERSIN